MKKKHKFLVGVAFYNKVTAKNAKRELDLLLDEHKNIIGLHHDFIRTYTTKSFDKIKAAQRGQMFKSFKKFTDYDENIRPPRFVKIVKDTLKRAKGSKPVGVIGYPSVEYGFTTTKVKKPSKAYSAEYKLKPKKLKVFSSVRKFK